MPISTGLLVIHPKAKETLHTAAILLYSTKELSYQKLHTFQELLPYVISRSLLKPVCRVSLVSISKVCSSAMLLLFIIGNEKYGVGVASIGTTFIPRFAKVDHLVQKLRLGTDGHTDTHAHMYRDSMVIPFTLRKESGVIVIKVIIVETLLRLGSRLDRQIQSAWYNPCCWWLGHFVTCSSFSEKPTFQLRKSKKISYIHAASFPMRTRGPFP
jgi:hypothetical protein